MKTVLYVIYGQALRLTPAHRAKRRAFKALALGMAQQHEPTV